jgi:dTDP-4-dehydrorhamnose 3,5-epimerase
MPSKGGNVFKMLSQETPEFKGFGEIYFSKIEPNEVKAWKKHKEMTLNLAVPVGKVEFVLFDDRPDGSGKIEKYVLGEDHYYLLTVPSGIWFGFRGISDSTSLVANCANIIHQDTEVVKVSTEDANFIPFSWE